MKQMAWFRAPRFEESLGKRLDGLFSQLKQWKTREVGNAVRLEFLYERDRFTTKSGRGYNLPAWVLEDYGWMADADVAAPRLNLIKSRVDTLTSLLFSSQPAVEIRVSGAEYEQQRQARAQTAALEATMNTDEAKEQLRLVLRDGLISNFGACMPVVRGNQVNFERIRLDQLFWDPYDARHGKPKSMHYVEYTDVDDFVAWYRGLDAKALKIVSHDKRVQRVKKLEPVTKLRESDIETPYDWDMGKCGITDSTERLRVVHSWRVATSPIAEDGRYVCTVFGRDNHGVVAIDTDYPRTTLPVCWYSPYPPIEGIVGSGYATLLVEAQRALDLSMKRLQNRIEKLGWAKLGVGGNVNEEMIENFVAEEITVVRLPGQDAPFQIDTQALSTHDIEWVNLLSQWTAQFYGINEALAQGASNRGATASGVAMYEEADRQIDRLSDIYEATQIFRLRVATETLNAIDDALRVDPKFRTTYRDKDGNTETFEWADISLPNGSYSLQIEEAGELGRTKAGRLAKIMEGAKLGIFSPETAAAAVNDTPDIRRLSRMANAGRRAIERDMAELVSEKGKHDEVIPTEDHDLTLAVKMVGDQINDAFASGAKPATIERLREYRRQAESLLQRIQAEAQMAQVQAAAATQAQGDALTGATDAGAAQMLAAAGGAPPMAA